MIDIVVFSSRWTIVDRNASWGFLKDIFSRSIYSFSGYLFASSRVYPLHPPSSFSCFSRWMIQRQHGMFESTAVPTLFSFLLPSLSLSLSSCLSFHFPTKLNKRNTRGRTRLSLDQVSRANQSTWQVTRCFSLSLPSFLSPGHVSQ